MRRARGRPILFLLIARPGELPSNPRAGRFREVVGFRVKELVLTPMTLQESGEHLTSLTTVELQPSPAVRRALLHAASGFPLVLELLFQDWQLHGDPALSLAVGSMTADFRGLTGPNNAYGHIVSHMLAKLDSQAAPCFISLQSSDIG